MPNLKQICLGFVLICALCSIAAAQESSSSNQRSTLTITANATGERVRITGPSSVVQMHVEVYAANGEKLFDQEIRGGNVFDWHLQDGQAQRLAPGVYVCVVTAKSVSGKITQKLGAVTVAEKSAGVQAGSPQLSLQQTQAIGPVEADSSWTIAGENEPQTPTVIASDGKEGQMIRGRGALTFRLGNFFSGIDTEQMRLTEEGNLGIGTAAPQAKLDVAGAIRAERFLVVKPGKTGSQAQADDSAQANSDSVQPLVAGTGTQSRLAKWTDNAGTLGDSGITETAGGNIGIGTASPGVALDVVTSGASTDLKVRESSRTVGLSSNWTGGISGVGTLTNNKFGIAANGGIGLLLDPSGNVGIGTTSPAVALDVVTAGAATDLQVREASRTVDISSNWTAGISGIGTTTNNKFGLAANKNIGLTLDTGGNVGIGTTVPTSRLEVNGLLTSTRTGVPGQYLQLNGGDPASIRLTAQSLPLAEKSLMIQNLSGEANNPGDFNTIQFQVGTTAAPSTKMIINRDGNVGIGTTTPFTRLSVERADSTALSAVSGCCTAVDGNSHGSGVGVNGSSINGIGLRAESQQGNLVEGWGLGNNGFLRRFHITNDGTYTAGSDFAEALPASGDRADYEPGDVLVVSTKTPGKVEKARRPYDARVAGVYSTRPGMLGADKQGASRVDADDVPVAIVGIVPTKVSARNGAIRVGDLLTTSNTAGYAMRCANRVKCVGASLGKAIEPLAEGEGIIKVLVMLR